MKRHITLFTMLAMLWMLCAPGLLAQTPEFVVKLVTPPAVDAESAPNFLLTIQVQDPETGQDVPGLTENEISVILGEIEADSEVTANRTGVAVAIVLDIANLGSRLDHAVQLAEQLVEQLTVDGSEDGDVVTLVVINNERHDGASVRVPLTDYDPQAVRNALYAARSERVNGFSPLVEGVTLAVDQVTQHPLPEMQAKLDRRQRAVFVFSDGIDKISGEGLDDVLARSQERGVMLHTVRMDAPGYRSNAGLLETMARETGGQAMAHAPVRGQVNPQVTEQLAGILALRLVYQVRFPVRQQGSHPLRITVEDAASGRSGALETSVYSPFMPPRVEIRTDLAGANVPATPLGYEASVVTLETSMTWPDGYTRQREPAEVCYFANEARIGCSNEGPGFPLAWDVAEMSPPAEGETAIYELSVEFEDPYLPGQRVTGRLNGFEVTWDRPLVPVERQHLWILPVLAAVIAGLLILLWTQLRTRRQVAAWAHRLSAPAAGQRQHRSTMPLTPSATWGTLKVVQGPNVGHEFVLSSPTLIFGRDDLQDCDYLLHEEHVSNPHFALNFDWDSQQTYIIDQDSMNKTYLNNDPAPIAPRQQYSLPPDSIIRIGRMQLQFKLDQQTAASQSTTVPHLQSVEIQ